MLRRVRIRFCPEARSGELPPATFLALYRQRLRWALGWDQVTITRFRHIRHIRHIRYSRYIRYIRYIRHIQVTIQHFRSIGTADLSCREKAALYWILPMRWALVFSAT